MRHSIKMMLAVVLTVMSFSAVQTVWAEDDGWLTVTGTIFAIDREVSTITIEDDDGSKVIIAGFPFGYLEREMAVEFAVGDCVAVEYAIVVCRCSEGSKNIAVALNSYCEATIEGGCVDGDYCYDDPIVLRDEDFYPLDKSRYGDDSAQEKRRWNDGKGGPVTIPPGD